MCANVSNAKLKHRVHYIEAVRLLSLHRTAPAILRFLHLVLHICVYIRANRTEQNAPLERNYL